MEIINDNIYQEVLGKEKSLLTSIFQSDKEGMSKFMTPDGLGVDGGFGFASQADLISGIHNLKSASWKLEQPQVIALRESSYLITYLLHQKGTFKEQAIPEKIYASTIWSNDNGQWKALFHQESVCEHTN